ncbi:MAG: pfs [Bacteriovoracaceae bacterium]|nr:pfs [Bacteriovoracaceae bacterium]
MESEEKALLSKISVEEISYGKSIKINTKQFDLPRCRIVVARSGVGLVKAGILLSLITEHLAVDAIVSLGVGGALDESLSVGDTVVAKQIIQHDSISSSGGGDLLMAPGELTLSAHPDEQVDPVMRSDSVLVEWIKSAIEVQKNGKVFEGTLLSGSEFVASPLKKQALRKLFHDALLVDMEAAALAQIARILKIPFVVAKTVADRAKPQTSISDDYKKFLESAALHSSAVFQSLLKTFG